MTPKALVRWERWRKGGLLHFVLMWGIVRCGGLCLICSVASISFSNWIFNRQMAHAGIRIELRLVDMVPFIPRLLGIIIGGAALMAVFLWYHMEAVYRRAQSSARA
jgi:hypothetical protein